MVQVEPMKIKRNQTVRVKDHKLHVLFYIALAPVLLSDVLFVGAASHTSPNPLT